MKERPILFNAEMVRATLREVDPKTQTRRIVKPHPNERGFWRHGTTAQCDDCGNHFARAPRKCQCGCTLFKSVEYQITKCLRDCPFGVAGDRLWVRETHAWADVMIDNVEREDAVCVAYKADKTILRHEGSPPLSVDTYAINFEHKSIRWRPSIHMPRWASRITLEITKVRVERLQDISEDDAKAEGCQPCEEWPRCADDFDGSYVQSYRNLWDSINGKGSWDRNYWVWVIEFKRC